MNDYHFLQMNRKIEKIILKNLIVYFSQKYKKCEILELNNLQLLQTNAKQSSALNMKQDKHSMIKIEMKAAEKNLNLFIEKISEN